MSHENGGTYSEPSFGYTRSYNQIGSALRQIAGRQRHRGEGGFLRRSSNITLMCTRRIGGSHLLQNYS
jgi:hypothetical protein